MRAALGFVTMMALLVGNSAIVLVGVGVPIYALMGSALILAQRAYLVRLGASARVPLWADPLKVVIWPGCVLAEMSLFVVVTIAASFGVTLDLDPPDDEGDEAGEEKGEDK